MIKFYYNLDGVIQIEFICDHCGIKLKKLSEGLIIYKKTIRNIITDFQIVHHGECADNSDEYPGSEELRNLKVSLVELMVEDLNKEEVKRIIGKMPS